LRVEVVEEEIGRLMAATPWKLGSRLGPHEVAILAIVVSFEEMDLRQQTHEDIREHRFAGELRKSDSERMTLRTADRVTKYFEWSILLT
jgi:hypothetical protein